MNNNNAATVGFVNNNTRVSDLTQYSNAGLITGVKVFWNNYISGLEVQFGGKGSNTVVGSNNQGLWDENFTLAQGDHIVEIFGRKTDVITCIGFKTLRGLTKVWGNPFDGEAFSLNRQGTILRNLKLGVSSQLSYIEAYFVDSLDAVAIPASFTNYNTQEFGKWVQGDKFDDYEFIKDKFNFTIAEVKVWHDRRYVYGVQFFYNMDGDRKSPGNHLVFANNLIAESLVLTPDDNIQKVYVSAGNWIDGITIITQNGKRLTAGGQGGNTYAVKAGQGRSIVAFSGVTKDYLQSLTVHELEL